jgi:tetratricopeptide (TPR) repeat protein
MARRSMRRAIGVSGGICSMFSRDLSPARLVVVLCMTLTPLAARAAPIGLLSDQPSVEFDARDEARDLLRAVAPLLVWGRAAEAEAMARQRLTAAPDDALAWEVLGVALAMQGDAPAAEAAYARSVEIEPARLTAWVKRGDLAEATGDVEAARAHWRRALEIAPALAVAHGRLGLSLADASDPTVAIEHLETAVAAQPPDALDFRPELALLYNRDGRPDDALSLLAAWEGQAAAGDPPTPLTLLALGNAHVALGDPDTAIERYRLALREAPDDMRVARALGATLLATGDAEGAAEILARPAAEEPVDVFANVERARALLATDRPAEAAEAAERAASLDASALSLAARAHLLAGDGEAAAGAVERLVERRPDDPASWRERGAVLGAMGRYEAAKVAYDAGLDRFPDDAILYRGRSIANARLDRLDLAAADAEMAGSLAPDWLEPRFLLGSIEEQRGETAAAESAYRSALSLDEDHWPSLVRLSEIALDRGDVDGARAFADRAVVASDQSPAAVAAREAAYAAGAAARP